MSSVWQYFSKCDDKNYAECITCKKVICRSQGCTTNMWKHMKHHHGLKLDGATSRQSVVDSQLSMLMTYYDPVKDNSKLVTCKTCRRTFKKINSNFSNLWRHRQCCNRLAPTEASLLEQTSSVSGQESKEATDTTQIKNSFDDSDLSARLPHPELSLLPSSSSFNVYNQPLKKPRKRRKTVSTVWMYFDRGTPEENCATCKQCKLRIRRSESNTSNLWTHLRRCHALRSSANMPVTSRITRRRSSSTNEHRSHDFESFLDEDNGFIFPDDYIGDVNNYFAESNDPAVENNENQPKKSNENQISLLLNCDSPVKPVDKVTKGLALYLIKDLPSYNALEGEGFNYLLNIIASNHHPPSSQHILEKVLSDLKAETTKVLKNLLRESVSSVSLLVDCWTDDVRQTSFITVYAYFINPKLSSTSTCSIALSSRTFPVNQLKESYFVIDSVNRWLRSDDGKQNQEESFRNDAASSGAENDAFLPYRSISFIKTSINISVDLFKDYKDTDSIRIMDCVNDKANKCFSEAASSCMKGTEPNIFKLVDSLLNFLRTDALALSRLRTIQKGLGSSKFLFLPSDMHRSLESAVKSLQLLSEIKSALLILFETSSTSDNIPILLQSDWTALHSTTQFLTKVDSIICNCQNASISWYIPTFLKLQTMARECREKNSKSDSWSMVKPLVNNFEFAVNEVLINSYEDTEYVLATFMDPG